MDGRIVSSLAVGGLLAGALVAPAGGDFSFVRQVSGIPVNVGSPLAEPFTGGLDSPKPELADLDADGDLDLLIVQPDGGITRYRNDGTPAAFLFRFVTDRLQGIDANTWATLADIDADGDLDLFTDGVGAVVFHRNVGSASQPNWQLETATWQGIANSGFGNTPAFVDVDGDSDLDYLEMEQNFGTARYFRNVGTAQVPTMVFVTDVFGCIDTYDPGLGARGGPGGGGAQAHARSAEPQHGISVISTADLDADLDVDILIGDLNNTNLWHFRNSPGACAPACTPATVCYQRITHDFLPITTLGLNQARSGDLDADGDLDLVVGVTNQGAAIDNLIHFVNAGSPQVPNYLTVDRNLIKAVDIGRSSHPALGDIDADGDLDLFLGADDGTVIPFINAGTPAAPSLVKQQPLADSSDLVIDVGFAAAPVWIDHEGDGDLDLFVGAGSPARVRFYRNNGTPQNRSLTLASSQFGNVQADFNAAPALGDLDADGDLDLLVGEFGVTGNPRLFYVRNTGTTQNPVWVTVSDNTPNTFVFAQRVYDGDLAPALLDLDGDGDLDLLLGERAGNVNFYRNTGTPQAFNFVLEAETFAGAEVGNESAPCMGDLTGDGRADLFVGEQCGGLDYYRRLPPIGIGEEGAPAPRAPLLVSIKPNPTRGAASITFDLAANGATAIDIYDLDGRLVRRLVATELGRGRHVRVWDGRDDRGAEVAAGVYFLRLATRGRELTAKVAVVR
jgi:hypothetical protein